MPIVEVADPSGTIVWRGPEVAEPLIEVVERVVRVTDLATGQVLATYRLKAGEQLVPDPSAT